MEELTPNTRYEKFLSAAAGSGTAPDPVTREEKFLKAIADNAGGGSGGGVLIANVSDGVLDKTYSEILASTTPVAVHQASEGSSFWGFVTAVFDDDGAYTVTVVDSSAQAVSYYVTDSADGYPELEQGGNAPK